MHALADNCETFLNYGTQVVSISLPFSYPGCAFLESITNLGCVFRSKVEVPGVVIECLERVSKQLPSPGVANECDSQWGVL